MREKAVFPGSFDPFTRAHLDLVREAIKFFDVVILIAVNPQKGGGMFTKDERFNMINMMLQTAGNGKNQVTVDVCEGLVTDYCQENNIGYIVRGIQYKNSAEELDLSHIYFEENGIKTVFFPTYNKEHEHISSTRVRAYISESIRRGGFGYWSGLVPLEFYNYIKNWIEQKRERKNV